VPRSVLVIDDDETFSTVRKICESSGIAVEHAKNVQAALPFVEAQPTLVVTARDVDDQDGLVWIAELRLALPAALIAVVGDARDAAVLDAGADFVFDRPLDPMMIASMLDEPRDHRLSLLIIEPDPHLSLVMKRWLGTAYDVNIVTAAWRALEELRSARFDAIVAELRLPDMDATEFYAALQRTDARLADRTLFMTAGFVADRAQQFLAKIPGQWIHKPFDLPRLRAALDALL
jgi:DNA-binding response OmpR family regulator